MSCLLYLVAPFRAHIDMGASPQASLTFGQCALGLPQFKAAGLAVVFDLTAHTFYRVSLVQVIRPARLT